MNKKKIVAIAATAIAILSLGTFTGYSYYVNNIKYDGIHEKDLVEIPIEEVTTEIVDPELIQENTVTNDTFVTEQLHQLNMMGISYAWDKVKLNHDVTIAVLDSGCRYTQPDLKGNIDMDLAYDAYHGCSLKDSPVANGDASGHGTWVCSTIGAIANNNYGLAGASYNAKIIPIKIANDSKEGYGSLIAMRCAYEYLMENIDNGKIKNLAAINISYCGNYAYQPLQDVINKMYNDYGVITVASAGNSGAHGSISNAPCYPSDFDNVLSVQAVDDDSSYATFSSWNENKDIAACGVSVPVMVSNKDKNEITYVSGTSFSSPYTAAIVGLLKGYKPQLSANEAVNILKSTATPIKNAAADHIGKDGCVGVVNIEKAMKTLSGKFVDGDINISKSKYTYTGCKIKPEVSVTIGNIKVDRSKYTVKYKNNVKIGQATITATAKKGSGYTGTIKKTFNIVPTKTTGLKVAKIKGKEYKLTWSKNSLATGYQLRTYDKRGDGSSWTTTKLYDVDTYSKGKNTAQVRTVTKVNGVKYYSAWSSKVEFIVK